MEIQGSAENRKGLISPAGLQGAAPYPAGTARGDAVKWAWWKKP